jgi:Phytanoyl-CoA dioxygenase (PhyH)
MNWLKRKARFVRALLRFVSGWWVYQRTGSTPASSYQAMIYLFCATRGRFNEVVSALITRSSAQAVPKKVNGVLGCFDQSTMSEKLAVLMNKGYLVFPSALSSEQCDRLMQFAMTTKAHVRRMDDELDARAAGPVLYDPKNPLAVRYDYATQDLLDCEDVQALLADETLLSFASQYLGATPKADILSMWWHTNFHSQPDSESAQFYHFDMDRLKWLKIFIYLTDVGPNDGPHAFISGSHKSDGIPSGFLDRGYVRLSDEEVEKHYGKSREISFVAPKGTIILEDTRGLHKGTAVQVGGNSRLLLQLQFSNSLFGAETPISKIRKIVDPKLKALVDAEPAIYKQYI